MSEDLFGQIATAALSQADADRMDLAQINGMVAIALALDRQGAALERVAEAMEADKGEEGEGHDPYWGAAGEESRLPPVGLRMVPRRE